MIEHNNMENNEIQLHIERIIGKTKERRKLTKADETEMIELSKAFFSEKHNWNQGLENLINLPAQSGAAVLINVWEIQNDQDKLEMFSEFLKKDKGPNAIIKQLYFINELFKKSPGFALEALHTVSIKVTDFGEKIPNKKLLITCAKTILVNECFLTMTPEEHPINKVDFPSTALLLVSSLLHFWENSARSVNELNTVHKLISWISLYGTRVDFEQTLRSELQEKAGSLDAESQSILYNLGFITKITETKLAAPSVEKEPPMVMEAQVKEKPAMVKEQQESQSLLIMKADKGSETRSAVQEGQGAETPSAVQEEQVSRIPFVAKDKQISKTTSEIKNEQISKRTKGGQLLKQLRDYLGDLETTNNELQEAVKTAFNEINIEKYKRQQLEVITEDLNKNLSEKKMENSLLIGQINQLNSELERMQQEIRIKDNEHQEKLKSLIVMTERESVFVKDEFKNKLSSRLRLEYQDFNDILSEEMTVDLGENLRAQLDNIFTLLKQEGMNF